jgi:hypothetical protein
VPVAAHGSSHLCMLCQRDMCDRPFRARPAARWHGCPAGQRQRARLVASASPWWCWQAGDASGTGVFKTAEKCWDTKAMAVIGAELAAQFPPLVGPNEVGAVPPSLPSAWRGAAGAASQQQQAQQRPCRLQLHGRQLCSSMACPGWGVPPRLHGWRVSPGNPGGGHHHSPSRSRVWLARRRDRGTRQR